MKFFIFGVFLLALIGSPSFAQSINIDLGISGTEPPQDYRAAGVPGVWNKFEAVDSTNYALVDLAGNPTTASVHQFGGTEIVQAPLNGPGQPSGPDAILLGDTLVTHTTIENCLFFNGLLDGEYEVTTYAWMPNSPTTENLVHIDEDPGVVINVGGAWTGAHAEQVTFARQLLTVSAGKLGPHSGIPPGGDPVIGAAMSAIQLRKLTRHVPLFTTADELSWLVAVGSTAYDVLEGDLGTLRATGDFALATSGCSAGNLAATTLSYPAETITPGEGRWYLVRGIDAGGPMTYDSGGRAQAAPRDAAIGQSAAACN
jgi:hypothetical protein